MEAERGRRAAQPTTAREREDAAPGVLRGLWEELAGAARRLDVLPAGQAAPASYDPVVYERVYRRVLTHRRTEVIAVERLWPDAPSSVYVFGFPTTGVVPSSEEAEGFIRAVERRYPDLTELGRDVGDWYVV